MNPNTWDRRIRRATELSSVYPFAAEGLHFYAHIAALQRNLYSECERTVTKSTHTSRAASLRDQLNISALMPSFMNFLTEVERVAPEPLAHAASRLAQNLSAAKGVLEGFWEGESRLQLEEVSSKAESHAGDAHVTEQCLAWLFLQPCAEHLAALQAPASLDGTPSICPACGSRPIVGVLRPEGDGARKSLICMLCAREWAFRRVYCPACGEEREPQLAFYSTPEIAHMRVDVCDTCHTYLKCVDLTKTGLAVPVVDELAALPLDLWARENGYRKLQINMLGT